MGHADVSGGYAHRASFLKSHEKSGCGIDRFVMAITSEPSRSAPLAVTA
jgi:hypothetical protein